MTTLSTDIRSAFCRIVKEALGIQAIQANQGKPLPKVGAFATVYLATSASNGRDEKTFDGDTETETISGRRTVTMRLNFYRRSGADPIDYAEQLRQYMQSSPGILKMQENSLGYLTTTPTLDVTAVEKGAFENRTTYDMTISMSTEYTTAVSRVDSATIEGEFHEGEKIPVDINVVPQP